MAPNPTVMKAVEQLGHRVTVGDVATQAGLDIKIAQRDLLALAAEAGGHMQVAETGEIAYQFSQNFRSVLRNKFLRLRLQEWWEKIWGVLFYLIRISFGIMLIVSIVLIFVTIIIIITAANSANREGENRGGYSRGGGFGGFAFFPRFWFGPDLWWFLSPNYGRRGYYPESSRSYRPSRSQSGAATDPEGMNFLEAIFSFLFGDGDPNADLEDRRWRSVATVIRNNKGAVAAEQIAPYLGELGTGTAKEFEDYMLPVLTRFNGQPEVSPDGELVYHFPELQVTASQQRQPASVSAYLREVPWRFSAANSGQIMLAIGLGGLNFIGALVLKNLLADGAIAAELGGFVAFVDSIFWFLMAYGTGFLAIPLIRYFWVQWRNGHIEVRNQQRQERAIALNQVDQQVQSKIAYAKQFAAATVISRDNLAYTTESDLIEQEVDQADKIDAEWRQRLEQSET
ncbi:MAG: hypothetical protein F6K19_09640 [Cyanothece sp. SIO1E1]|nr:hypothetical protein [Cyanothece sp. SIO1E1]